MLTGPSCHDCTKVNIHLPRAAAKDKISSTINNALEEEMIAQLTFDEETEASDIDGAIQSFTREYRSIRSMHPVETQRWEAKITAEVSFEDARMITIKIDSYLFTGGAHGYGSTRFLNFNKKRGSEMQSWELFSDRKDFQRYAENRFRRQENIPQDGPINSTGYMFERDTFYLPENIGFTEEGIKLYYNQYEVTSYADGPVELILPYQEVKKYLSGKIKS
jgi:hypothetical protein